MRPESAHGDMQCLGVSLARHSPCARFCLLSLGVFVMYVIYGYIQELLFRTPDFGQYSWFLTFYQFCVYMLLAHLDICFELFRLTGQLHLLASPPRRIPLSTYVLLALLTVGTMGLSNQSVGYLNYPTQVIFKSCKLIPVLVGGIVIQRKTYGVYDWLSCGLMSIGLAWFVLADSSVQPDFNALGVFIVVGALCFDAVIGNVQEKAMKQYGASEKEVIFYSYLIGMGYIALVVVAQRQLAESMAFWLQHPMETFGYGLVFSISGYLGIGLVLTLVREFGALAAVTVTTCRKAVTIVLSFVLFAKPFTIQYVWAGAVVMLAIYLNLYSKHDARLRAAFVHVVRYVLARCRRNDHRPHQMMQV